MASISEARGRLSRRSDGAQFFSVMGSAENTFSKRSPKLLASWSPSPSRLDAYVQSQVLSSISSPSHGGGGTMLGSGFSPSASLMRPPKAAATSVGASHHGFAQKNPLAEP